MIGSDRRGSIGAGPGESDDGERIAARVRLALGEPAPPDLRHLLPPCDAPHVDEALSPIEERWGTPELILRACVPWPARDVWRALISLGFTWGAMNLFHLGDASGNRSLYHVHALTEPYAFLPERAAEGERIHGLVVASDPTWHPSTRPVRRHMVMALAALQALLGGTPVDRNGEALDGAELQAWANR